MTVRIDQAFIESYINGNFGLPIAHENITYSPVAGQEYVELLMISNDITPYSLNDSDETDGLFRVILYWPVNKGSIQAKLKADEILGVFKIGTIVTYDSQKATVTKTSRAKGFVEGEWYKIILTINYYANIRR